MYVVLLADNIIVSLKFIIEFGSVSWESMTPQLSVWLKYQTSVTVNTFPKNLIVDYVETLKDINIGES